MKNHVVSNLEDLKKDVMNSCIRANRNIKHINIVAVSKTINKYSIVEAIESGQVCFGENKVQEAKKKWPEIRSTYPKLKLHMIGPLQSNKVKDALNIFDVIETIDREKLVLEILKHKKLTKKEHEFYVQVNIGEEAHKNGCAPNKAIEFINECNSQGLKITGVMGIAPLNVAPAPYFALLKNIANKLSLKNISMGMSMDFEDAIYLGSTSIRIGTKIFGERKKIINNE